MRAAVDSEYAINEKGMTQAEVELWIDKKLADIDRWLFPLLSLHPKNSLIYMT